MGGAATLAASSLQPNAQSTTSGQGENTAHFASRSSVNLPRIPGRSLKFKQNADLRGSHSLGRERGVYPTVRTQTVFSPDAGKR